MAIQGKQGRQMTQSKMGCEVRENQRRLSAWARSFLPGPEKRFPSLVTCNFSGGCQGLSGIVIDCHGYFYKSRSYRHG